MPSWPSSQNAACVFFTAPLCYHFTRVLTLCALRLQRKKQQHKALRALNSREYRARKQLVKRRERLGRSVAQLLPATNGGAPSGKELIDNSACHSLKVKCIPKMRGVGVFAEAGFKPGQVLVRYAGETVSLEEGDVREAARRTGPRDLCLQWARLCVCVCVCSAIILWYPTYWL